MTAADKMGRKAKNVSVEGDIAKCNLVSLDRSLFSKDSEKAINWDHERVIPNKKSVANATLFDKFGFK